MIVVWILGLDKKRLVLMVVTENKIDYNVERGPLKYQDRFFRQMRGFPGCYLALGRITYSYLSNQIFI